MSDFNQRRRARLETEIAGLLSQGSYALAAGKQAEVCQLVAAGEPRDVGLLCAELGALAELRHKVGQMEASREAYLEARTELETYLRARHPDLIDEFSDGGNNGVEVRHRVLDYDVRTAQLLNRLAMLYHRTDRDDQARPLLEKAMAIARRQLGVEHPDFAILLSNFASIQHASGRFAEAEELYRQALKALRSVLGEDHPELAQSQLEMGHLYSDWRRPRQALQWFEKALETLRRACGDETPALVDALRQVARVHAELGDLTAAEWHLLRARRILEALGNGAQMPVLEQLLEVYRRMEDVERAEALSRQIRELAHKAPHKEPG